MDFVGDPLPTEREWSARVGIEISPMSSMGPGMQQPPPKPWGSTKADNEELTASAGTPWPGSDLKLQSVIPDSVYLWACGEPFSDDNISRVSRSQAAAAWVILITQAACYAGLWYVGGNKPSDDSQSSSAIEASSETTGDYSATDNVDESASEKTADYSIVATAGAMYLILSIAAADVWCGCALILEGRGQGFPLFTRRRVFGVFLLATFLTLVGASIRVLFYSAKEDVHLVIGAAAVLFIADVDEKAMSVLKNISGEWVLFWVLEVIGLSFGLAVFAVKVTGNTDAIDNHDHEHRCTPWDGGGCSIFSWNFVVNAQPTAVTAFAFLLTSVIVRTTSSFAGRTLFPRSCKWSVITLVMLCWVAQGSLWVVHPEASTWFDSVSGGCSLVFVMICYRRELTCANCAQILRKGVRHGGYRLMFFGGLLISLGFILEVVPLAISNADREGFYMNDYDDCLYVLDFAFAVMYLMTYVWLINGLRLANLRSAALGSDVALIPFLRPMLVGWGISQGYFAVQHWVFLHAWKLEDVYPKSFPGIQLAERLLWLMWHVVVGTVLWGQAAGSCSATYWTATTLVRTVVVGCATTWVFAIMDKTVT